MLYIPMLHMHQSLPLTDWTIYPSEILSPKANFPVILGLEEPANTLTLISYLRTV